MNFSRLVTKIQLANPEAIISNNEIWRNELHRLARKEEQSIFNGSYPVGDREWKGETR